MILFISNIGESLPIVHRINNEGLEAKIYIHNNKYKHSYDGILDKVELSDLKKTMMDAERIVFDSNVNLGPLMDDIAHKTISMPVEIDEKELIEISGIGIKKDISGIRIVAETWFDGKDIVLSTYSLPNQRLLTGGLGLEMASQSNCLWVSEGNGFLSNELKSIIPLLASSDYIGPVSIDCTVSSNDKKPHLNSWRFGFRYDNIFCLLSLLGKAISSFFLNDFLVKTKDFSCSERVTIPPYPYIEESLLNELARDVNLNIDLNADKSFWGQDIKKDKSIKCAGNDGLLGVMASTGKSIEDGFGKIFKAIRKLNIESPLQFRIDGAKESNKSYKKLRDWNICID